MFAKSLISKIHPNKKPYKKDIVDKTVIHKGCYKVVTIEIQPMLCEINDELGILSKVDYVHKEGYFFIVINIHNEVFFLDSHEIDFKGHISNLLVFINSTPKYIDCIEEEIFSLDLL